MSKNVLNGSRRYFDKICASYIISFLGLKKSRTNLFKREAIFTMTKQFGIFFLIIECDKQQGTFCKGPKGIPTITVEVITSLL